MQSTWFTIVFGRRFCTRKRFVKSTIRVKSATAFGAGSRLLTSLTREAPCGVYTIYSIEPSETVDAKGLQKVSARVARASNPRTRMILEAIEHGIRVALKAAGIPSRIRTKTTPPPEIERTNASKGIAQWFCSLASMAADTANAQSAVTVSIWTPSTGAPAPA